MKQEDREIFWSCVIETLEEVIDNNSHELSLEVSDRFDVINSLIFNICNHYATEEKNKNHK